MRRKNYKVYTKQYYELACLTVLTVICEMIIHNVDLVDIC